MVYKYIMTYKPYYGCYVAGHTNLDKLIHHLYHLYNGDKKRTLMFLNKEKVIIKDKKYGDNVRINEDNLSKYLDSDVYITSRFINGSSLPIDTCPYDEDIIKKSKDEVIELYKDINYTDYKIIILTTCGL